MNNTTLPYVWTVLVAFLIGSILIVGVLYLRPALDPLVVITTILGFIISIGTSVAAFIKTQETHTIVNSELDKWKRTYGAMQRAEGFIEGGDTERAAEKSRKAKSR